MYVLSVWTGNVESDSNPAQIRLELATGESKMGHWVKSLGQVMNCLQLCYHRLGQSRSLVVLRCSEGRDT